MADPYADLSPFQLECLTFDLALQLDMDHYDDAPRDPFGPPYDRVTADTQTIIQITPGGTR